MPYLTVNDAGSDYALSFFDEWDWVPNSQRAKPFPILREIVDLAVEMYTARQAGNYQRSDEIRKQVNNYNIIVEQSTRKIKFK